jgi:glycosyltransferase involved in cell wall biosynthesis
MRLTIVQYAGDYREAFERFAQGGKSTYHAQRYSVDFVGELAGEAEQVTTLCALSSERYDVMLPNGVRAIGAGLRGGFKPRELLPLLAMTQPDRLCLRTPMVPLLKWARRNKVRTMTMLADSFGKGGPRTTINNLFLARELNRPNVEIIGNHGIGACLSLLGLGVRPDKLVPWDWPRMHQPYDYAPRTLERAGKFRLAYVGSVSEEKGVGDLLRALRLLDNVSLTIIGKSDESMKQLSRGLDVRFTGVVWNEEMPQEMRKADAIVVPSRHEYPEGLPGTIYQALAARTPIIASDHPMFRGAVAHEQSALVFPARDEKALAFTIRRLAGDADLYARLSANSLEAWEALQLPVKWGELIQRWVSGQHQESGWLERHRLESGLYNQQIRSRLTENSLDPESRETTLRRPWSGMSAAPPRKLAGLALATETSRG